MSESIWSGARVEQLEAALSVKGRSDLVEILEELHDRGAEAVGVLPKLMRFSHDRQHPVRVATARTIGHILAAAEAENVDVEFVLPFEVILPAFAQLVADPVDVEVREAGCEAAAQLGERTRGALVKVLQDAMVRHTDIQPAWAAMALARIAGPEARHALWLGLQRGFPSGEARTAEAVAKIGADELETWTDHIKGMIATFEDVQHGRTALDFLKVIEVSERTAERIKGDRRDSVLVEIWGSFLEGASHEKRGAATAVFDWRRDVFEQWLERLQRAKTAFANATARAESAG